MMIDLHERLSEYSYGYGVTRETALGWLGESVARLGDYALTQGKPVFYEPLNRYETNLINTLTDTVAFLEKSGAGSVKILADLFHMNIEEASIADALRLGGARIGHIHFADSDRRAIGCKFVSPPTVPTASGTSSQK